MEITPLPWIMIIVAALLVVGAAIAYYAFKIKKKNFDKTGKHPKGHYIGLGMGCGMAIGIPIGIAMGMNAIGLGIGLCLGLAAGTYWEKQHESELRELTKEEKELQQKSVYFVVGMLILGVIVALAVFFLRG